MAESQSAVPEAAGVSPPAPAAHPFTVEVRVRLQALAVPEPEGGYSVIVPALPGCVTDAETVEQVLKNLRDVAELWLNAGHDLGKAEALRVALGQE